MTDSPKKYCVTWDQMHQDAKALAWRLLDQKEEFKGIIAVTRGGMIPACIIARELNLRMIETFCVASYDHKNQGNAAVLKESDAGDGEGWVVIDDLVDSGNTYRLIREHLPKAHFACVYAKPAGVPTADTFVTEVSQDTWVYFPWDMEVQYIDPLVKGGE